MPRTLVAAAALVLALVLALSGAGPVAPAAAYEHQDWGSTKARDQKFRPGQHCYPYRYRVDPPTDDWAAEIFLVGPGGVRLAHHAVDVDADPATGRRTWCFWGGSTRPGRFKIKMRVTWQSSIDDVRRGWVKPSYFRLRPRG